MAEFSGLWTTSGAGSGDQQVSYTQAQDALMKKIMAAVGEWEGVAPNYLNCLEGTVTGANTVAINTGGALVDGKYYSNSASVNVNIPSAVGGGNTRYDRIVLRCTWASFTVRITRIPGTDAALPVPPAITQTPGTTYDIPLYKVLVDTGGTVTLWDDERQMASALRAYKGNGDSNWYQSGTNVFAMHHVLVQMGRGEIAVGQNHVDITWAVNFSQAPIIFLSAVAAQTAGGNVGLFATATATTGAAVTTQSLANVSGSNAGFSYIAIGKP